MLRLKFFFFIFMMCPVLAVNGMDKLIQKNLHEVVEHFITSSSPSNLDWNWEEAIGLHGLNEVSGFLPIDLKIRSRNYIKKYHDYWHRKQPKINWADEVPSFYQCLISRRSI